MVEGLQSDEVQSIDVYAVVGGRPKSGIVPENPRRGVNSRGLCGIPGVHVFNVHDAVVVVVLVEVVLDTVRVEVAGPVELVDPAVVVVVLIIGASARPIDVLIGYPIVVVIHWILVDQVVESYGLACPWVNSIGIDMPI